MNFSIKPMLVTPKYAEELLKMNISNRKVRESKVDSLAESMRKGEWELSNDAIVISEGNILLNGQHRLLAVIKSGIACNFILFTGATDSSFDIMDTPVQRSISDVIQHKGGTQSLKISSAIAIYSRFHYDYSCEWECLFRFTKKAVWTRRQTIDFYEQNKDDLDKWTKVADRIIGNNVPLVTQTTIAGFGHFLETIMHHNEDQIIEFFKDLIVDGRAKNSTILYVRKKLIRHKMKIELLPSGDDIRYMIRAWNDFVLGKESQMIRSDQDCFRFIRPV